MVLWAPQAAPWGPQCQAVLLLVMLGLTAGLRDGHQISLT